MRLNVKTIDKEKLELNYLNVRNDIEDFVDKIGYQNILKHMLEDLDHIDDINNIEHVLVSNYFCIRTDIRDLSKVKECLTNINK